MPYVNALYGQNCILKGVKNIVIFAIQEAVSEIQLFLAFRGNLALISTN